VIQIDWKPLVIIQLPRLFPGPGAEVSTVIWQPLGNHQNEGTIREHYGSFMLHGEIFARTGGH